MSFNANKLLLTLSTIIDVMEKRLNGTDGGEGLSMDAIIAAAHGALELATQRAESAEDAVVEMKKEVRGLFRGKAEVF